LACWHGLPLRILPACHSHARCTAAARSRQQRT
jgi:hypothetical protein